MFLASPDLTSVSKGSRKPLEVGPHEAGSKSQLVLSFVSVLSLFVFVFSLCVTCVLFLFLLVINVCVGDMALGWGIRFVKAGLM